MRETINENAQEQLYLVSRKKKDDRRSKTSLGRNVRYWTEIFEMSKIVIALSAEMQQTNTIRYTEGLELSQGQCLGRLRATAVWRCFGVSRWAGGDVVASANGYVPFLKDEVQLSSSKLDFTVLEAGFGHLHEYPADVTCLLRVTCVSSAITY